MDTLLIGQLARRAGVTTHTIRYYEALGLLSRPARTAAGYRRYPPSAVDELRFIKRAQSLGFGLDEIAEILRLSRSGRAPCSRVLAMARAHIAELGARIERLQALRDRLERALSRWEAGGVPADCAATFCGLIAEAVLDPLRTAAASPLPNEARTSAPSTDAGGGTQPPPAPPRRAARQWRRRPVVRTGSRR